MKDVLKAVKLISLSCKLYVLPVVQIENAENVNCILEYLLGPGDRVPVHRL